MKILSNIIKQPAPEETGEEQPAPEETEASKVSDMGLLFLELIASKVLVLKLARSAEV
jgi:hypothetical protein